MSRSRSAASRGVEEDLVRADLAQQARVSDCGSLDEVHSAPEQLFEIFVQAEVLLGETHPFRRIELHGQIEVAGRSVEPAADRGAEEAQPPDAVAAAEISEIPGLLLAVPRQFCEQRAHS